MSETPPPQSQVPHDSEPFGTVRKHSESFRSIPHLSEPFGTFPKGAEPFGSLPKPSERKENHTLTVRDAARMFEEAGVARTERSIVNWCQPNRTGIARLDSYFDPNERKYYLTTGSVERAIEEEIQKATKQTELSEPFGTVPQTPEPQKSALKNEGENKENIDELKKEILDLKITNRGKDFFIEQLQKERENILAQLVQSSHRNGVFENRLLQLENPKNKIPPEDAGGSFDANLIQK